MRGVLAAVLVLALIGGQIQMMGALLGRYHAQKQMHRQIEGASASPEGEEATHLTLPRSERQSAS